MPIFYAIPDVVCENDVFLARLTLFSDFSLDEIIGPVVKCLKFK